MMYFWNLLILPFWPFSLSPSLLVDDDDTVRRHSTEDTTGWYRGALVMDHKIT